MKTQMPHARTATIRTTIVLFAVVMLLISCIPSVNPFYTDKDVVFDARLVGEWQEKDKTDEPQVWKFERGDDKAYKLTVMEKEGKQGEFDARLFKLKENYFLDLIPADCNYATNQADLVAMAMFPGHLILRVPQIEPALKFALSDFDWLEKYLKKNPKSLAHHVENKRGIVLTAETRDLQRFVLQHLGTNELFSKTSEFFRKTNSVPARLPR